MSLNTACYPSYPSSHMVTCLIEPWPRQLDRKLDSYLAGYSTATRQDSSTATQQLLDRPRHVDRTPLTACAWASRCQARQLETGSTARQTRLTDLNRRTDLDAQAHAVRLDGRLPARQLLDSLLDSYLTGSTGKALTAPRQRPRQRLDGEPRAQLDRLGDSPGPWAWGQGS